MNKEQLKKIICDAIETSSSEIEQIALDIEKEPELGFKEVKTAAKVATYMKKLGLEPQEGLALTGVKGRAKSGKAGPTVAVLGELDGIACPSSPKADPMTGATHSCGHNLQVATMLAVCAGFLKTDVLKELAGDVVFFGVPAEEYVEIAYRSRLIEEGKTHFLSGKGELIYKGEFDDIDMAMQMHSNGNMPQKAIAIGTSSNGFIGKTIQYIGKTAHAAAAPHEGINALNAAMIGLMSINSLRETFKEEDVIRVHPIITKGGDLVNSVPDDVRMETYVRAKTMIAIENTHHKVDAALRAGGDAIGAKVVIDTMPGQLPLSCNKTMNDLFVENIKEYDPTVEVLNVGHFSASTDMGDLSHIMPVIHPFVGGADGSLHTAGFKYTDFNDAVILPAKGFAMLIVDLLFDDAKVAKEILAKDKPLMTREEYVNKLNSYFSK